MDAVVDVRFAGELARLGGLAVLNLEGVQTRYDDPDAVLARIAAAPDSEVQAILAEAYAEPIREELIARRIDALHAAGSPAAVAATPAAARRFGPFCAEHGADLFLVQSQVSSARHLASGYDPLELADFTRFMRIPVAVGNTTSFEAAYQLMGQGIAAIFVGVGPGAACTTRDVLGIGVPQVTAISDVAAARDTYFEETGRYVPVVGDGGMRRGGELAKAIAAGADVLMLGSPLARSQEAPGRGTNWGMAAPSPTLPRGTRIKVGTAGPLERILLGPARVTDGTENLVGALRQSMAALGARTIREMQQVEMVTRRPSGSRASPGSGRADRGGPGGRGGDDPGAHPPARRDRCAQAGPGRHLLTRGRAALQVIAAFENAGITLEQLRSGISEGTMTLDYIDLFYPDPGPRSTRSTLPPASRPARRPARSSSPRPSSRPSSRPARTGSPGSPSRPSGRSN